MIKLFYCIGCKKARRTVVKVKLEKDATITEEKACLECLDLATEVIRSLKKLNQAEKLKVVDYVMNHLVKYK